MGLIIIHNIYKCKERFDELIHGLFGAEIGSIIIDNIQYSSSSIFDM